MCISPIICPGSKRTQEEGRWEDKWSFSPCRPLAPYRSPSRQQTQGRGKYVQEKGWRIRGQTGKQEFFIIR